MIIYEQNLPSIESDEHRILDPVLNEFVAKHPTWRISKMNKGDWVRYLGSNDGLIRILSPDEEGQIVVRGTYDQVGFHLKTTLDGLLEALEGIVKKTDQISTK